MRARETTSSYKPSLEDLKKVKFWEDFFLLSWDWVFHTVQWEWNYIGRSSTFVRLHNCNLQCSWCDSWYTWKKDTEEFYKEPFFVKIEELFSYVIKAMDERWVNTVSSSIRLDSDIVFTGWEPLLQKDKIEKFIKMYENSLSWKIQIETNWTIMPSNYLLENAKFNCSPKLWNSWMPLSVRRKDDVLFELQKTKDVCFKFVVTSIEDIDEIERDFWFLDKKNIYLMPEGILEEDNNEVFKKILDYAISKSYNITPRMQNILFWGAKRRV